MGIWRYIFGILLTLEIKFTVMKRLLFVCMGNICRSPMALAAARKIAADAGCGSQFEFDSAGTHTHHSGEKPDPRVRVTLSRHGYALERFRARRIAASDFEKFDFILAVDARVLVDLQKLCPSDLRDKLCLFLGYAEDIEETEIPDPYFGNTEGFERVLNLCEAGVRGLLRRLA